MNEIQKVKQRYERRKLNKRVENIWFSKYVQYERELKCFKIVKDNFTDLKDKKILEIGAGSGDDLLAFKRFGFKWQNIYANELLEDRVKVLKENLPISNIYSGDALKLKFKDEFDIVFQSTVFTSILDDDFKQRLANKMYDMAKMGGVVMWYDFKYNNPNNQDVKGIGKNEIKKLFPKAKKIIFHNVTLAPPIGRRVGKIYNLINFLFPFLRTHVIAEIYK
jgi:ubiquinone/menaquinone biosynthesis C-methylase UbiE